MRTQYEVWYTEFHSGILKPTQAQWGHRLFVFFSTRCTGPSQYLEYSRYSILFVCGINNDGKIIIPRPQFPKRKKGKSSNFLLNVQRSFKKDND